jgi:acyl-CoA thioesterase-1
MKWALVLSGFLLACSSERNMDAAPKKERMRAPAVTVPTAAPAAKIPTVIFFGTSITAGYGLDPDSAYPAQVARLAARAGTPINAENAGLSGETSAGAEHRIEWVLRTPADIVVLEVGANDGLRGLDPSILRADLERVIASVKSRAPKARIVLAQFEAPPNYGADYTSRFHAAYPSAAKKEGVELMPFPLDGVAGISSLNQSDGVHPNLAGERIVAANVWKTLAPLVQQLYSAR